MPVKSARPVEEVMYQLVWHHERLASVEHLYKPNEVNLVDSSGRLTKEFD